MDETTRVRGDGAPRLLGGRYEVRGRLGHGGMADVVRSLDRQLDREVAVKILHARYAQDPAFLERFRREAQAAASLSHPNVVAVYDAGEDDGRPFIVMELVDGESLSGLLARGRLPQERALAIAADAALGVHYAHERGLIHRDIKPGNILVADDGHVKVTDFGIARAVNAETVTHTAAVFGTAAYIAPEQAQGADVDRRTDVYALGCVLYELVTGHQPFDGDSAVTLAYKHVSELPVPPSEVADDVPASLDAIAMKALAKDPDQRYQTARELQADLQRISAGVPVAAPPAVAWAASVPVAAHTGVLETGDGAGPDFMDDEDEEAADEPAGARRGLVLGLLVLGVILVFALGAWLLSAVLGQDVETFALPDVRGGQQEGAQTRLEELGLEVTFATEQEFSEEYEAGTIADTDPEPGAEVAEGDTVQLTVSAGPEMTLVPQIVGLDESEALAALDDSQLTAGERTEQETDDAEEGTVLSASPEPSEEVQVGTPVDYTVAVEPNLVSVPLVVTFLEEDARETLAEACEPEPCFSVGVEYEADDTVEDGRVIRQDPEHGQEAEPGSTVDITVSTGPDTVELPDVENQQEGQAVDRLQNACEPAPCVDVEVDRAYDDGVEQGRVISQDPGPGSEVDIGSEVTIVVSRGSEPDNEPEPDDPGDEGATNEDDEDEDEEEDDDEDEEEDDDEEEEDDDEED